jgi:cytochrome c553
MNGRTTKGHRSWRVEGCSQPSFNAAPHGSVIVLGGLLGSLLFLASPVHAEFSSKEDGTRFFEEKIRPVLAEKCYSCHSAESEKLKGSLQVDHLEHLLAGGDTGPSLVPGKPDDSLLVEAIAYGNPDLRMPPKEKLSAAVVEDFRKWITGGAPWPEESVPQTGKKVAGAGFDLEKRHAEHWSWRPIVKPAVPAVKDTIWASTPVDAFLLAKIEAAGLRPAEAADDRTWLRRVYFDLTGLPPTPEQIAVFLTDTSTDRREKVVDALLASPHFGEKWARHWMDLVRYAETHGHEFDYPIDHAFEYRDYLIRAFNENVPFDVFAKEHIAGDLLSNPRRHATEGFNESILGTGFWYLNEATHAPTDVLADESDHQANQIDVYSKAFLGLTVSCARCHDHKFDAISTADYYALTGYLHSSARTERSMDPGGKRAAAAAKQRELLAKADATLSTPPPIPPARDEPDAALFADFDSADLQPGWSIIGEAFAPTGPSPKFTLEKGLVLTTPGTLSSARLGEGHSGVLRSPTFTIDGDVIHVRLRARGGMMRVVIDNYHMAMHQPLLFRNTIHKNPDTKGEFAWMRFDGDLKKYRGHRAYLEFVDPGPGYYEIDEIRFTEKSGPAPEKSALALTAAPSKETEALLAEGRRIAAALPPERFALTMAEGTPENARVYGRGSHRSPGEEVPRRFLTALGGKEGSRLTLAEETVSPENPLTSRVAVNRIWHHLFGRGLVPSVDDFGPMGQMPSHPELLDWLATDFVANGWSLKHTIRTLVLTNAYAQASVPHPDMDANRLATADPTNTLLHRMPVRRLSAEAIRDQFLAVSGSLDPALFGPSVPTFRTDFMTGRGARPSGPLDGNGRRAIYGSIYRNFLPPLLMTFDMPNPFGPKGARSNSNVPAQALALMNDPYVADQAKKWATRLLAEPGLDDTKRISRMVESATGRTPDKTTIDTLTAFLDEQSTLYGARDERVWSDLAHVVFNSKDFLYLR